MNTSDTVNADPRLKPLYRIGGAAALFAGAIYLERVMNSAEKRIGMRMSPLIRFSLGPHFPH
jgi:hypothetical protein